MRRLTSSGFSLCRVLTASTSCWTLFCFLYCTIRPLVPMRQSSQFLSVQGARLATVFPVTVFLLHTKATVT